MAPSPVANMHAFIGVKATATHAFSFSPDELCMCPSVTVHSDRMHMCIPPYFIHRSTPQHFYRGNTSSPFDFVLPIRMLPQLLTAWIAVAVTPMRACVLATGGCCHSIHVIHIINTTMLLVTVTLVWIGYHFLSCDGTLRSGPWEPSAILVGSFFKSVYYTLSLFLAETGDGLSFYIPHGFKTCWGSFTYTHFMWVAIFFPTDDSSTIAC